MNRYEIAPSLICADLTNLIQVVADLKESNLKSIHIDLIDGHFSPSLPIGFKTIESLAKITDQKLDIHIMSNNNDFMVSECLKYPVNSICFHWETTLHVQRLINMVKEKGIKVGIALNPATDIQVLKGVLKQLDYVLLMLISPGYASDCWERMVDYAEEKVRDMKNLIVNMNSSARIIVDGRVSIEKSKKLVDAGAYSLVSGSTGVYRKGFSVKENVKELKRSIEN